MTDNVIRPNFGKIPEAHFPEPSVPAEPVPADETHKDANLAILRHTRYLVENDQLEGLIIIGRRKGGGAFYTDLSLDQEVISPLDHLAYVGVLETLKLELADIAAMAPAMMDDGSILDPHEVIEG